MKMYGLMLMLAFGLNCKGSSDSKPGRIAGDLSLQSDVKISMHVPRSLAGKKLRVQIGGLSAEKPPEVLFELSLRCVSTKTTHHLGYINFFNAVGKLGREPTFTFDLPDLARTSCPLADLYLAIEPQGVVAPDSFPHVKYVNLLADSDVTSAPRD
jgi:hypothetical protein